MLKKYKIRLENDLDWTEILLNANEYEATPEVAIEVFLRDHPEWYFKYIEEFGGYTLNVEVISEFEESILYSIDIELFYNIKRLTKNN